MNDLNRVEATIISLGQGLASEWSRDHVHALGLSSIYNPLGAAVLHLIDHRNGINLRIVGDFLAAQLVKLKVCKAKDSGEIAREALLYWLHKHCPTCKGAGKNFDQIPCKECDGTGRLPVPAYLEHSVAIIEGAIEWLDAQQAKKLHGAIVAQYKSVLPDKRIPDAQVYGWVTQPVYIE